MSKKLEGHGRLVPTRSTGIAYRVRHGIRAVEDVHRQGRGMSQMLWAKCSVDVEGAGRLPDGTYFLYSDDGKVHQVKSTDGKWCYLAVAA